MYIYRKKTSKNKFEFFFKFFAKKKNFSDVALFATSENSDVVNSETSEFFDVSLFTTSKKCFFFLFSSLLDIWLKILFNFLIKFFKI
jgi:hypothetical protein